MFKLNVYTATDGRRDIHQCIEREARYAATQQVIHAGLGHPATTGRLGLSPGIFFYEEEMGGHVLCCGELRENVAASYFALPP